MEIKIDHQTCYNLIICYYVLGHTEKMKTCFTKMILVRNYDADSDDENEDTAMLRVCSRAIVMNSELRSHPLKAALLLLYWVLIWVLNILE
jgi:intraflagellar transport protein 88